MASYRIPGPLQGLFDNDIDQGTLCRSLSPLPGPHILTTGYHCLFAEVSAGRSSLSGTSLQSDTNPAKELALSGDGLKLLKDIETLRLKPYDDQTGKEINAWVAGATVGYGHLIKAAEWNLYKNGITEFTASTLFGLDLTPFVTAVRSRITSSLEQHQFDALVMLAFNIGAGANGFAGSSVVKMINDPTAKTNYPNLEAAWKAWNKSQGKVLKGLENRRACEWVVFSQGVYKKW